MSRDLAIRMLETDRVLTGRQLYTYYGVHPKVLTNLGRRDVTLGPRKNWSRAPITVRFYGVRQRDLDRLHPAALGHYAGIADMRYRLQVEAEDWTLVRSGSYNRLRGIESGRLPDATYAGSTGRIAVEYDTGTYSSSLVAEKLGDYYALKYSATVWGVTSRLRQQRVAQLAADHGLPVRMLNATWWQY